MLHLQKTIFGTDENDLTSNFLFCAENLFWLENETVNNQLGLKNKVDLCYIDPPYNTGNTLKTGFTYNDAQEHEAWLVFMSERLKAIKNFLKPTGIVAISIDDSEVHYLKVLCDEIYGKNNFIAQLTIDGGANKNNSKFFSVTHEYVLIYAQNINSLNKAKIKWRTHREGSQLLLDEYEKVKAQTNDLEKITNHLKQWVKTQPLSPRLKKFYNADENGLYTYADLSVPGNRYNYVVYHPITHKPVAEPSRGWGLNEEKFKQLDSENQIIWGKDETKQPLKKKYLTTNKDQVMKSVLSYPSRSSTHLLEKLLDKRQAFNNPKNLQLMKDLIDYMVPPDGTVLDIFAGTGTTGHAVLELNNENPANNRNFVLITRDENNIFKNVTEPRLKKVYDLLKPERSLKIYTTT